jgi:NADH-quinone oxidoreductase subunit L
MMPILIVVLPLLLAAFLSVVLRNNPASIKYMALGASILSLLLTIYLFLYSQNTYQSFTWFSLSGYAFNISASTAGMSMMLLMLVSIITPLIFLYSIGFMELPSEQSRFYLEMCLFAAAMMLFAVSASFVTLLIGWEMLGITSYLLIGFFYGREEAPDAARKAITTIIIGDIAMLAAVAIILNSYHSLEYSVLLSAPQTAVLALPAALILIAAFTKSAQFPFHAWLPDAMEGPTPVSAFLHSSTMVKAGVFLVAVLLPIFQESGLMSLILAVGIISTVIGATNALVERHIKRILAYSTIEDMGLMFIALGFGSVLAAMLLFFVQTFYKALLFMGAGAIMKANDGREDLFNVYNSSSNKLLFAAIAIGALSIAGFPPLGGFFGKYAVEGSSAANLPVYAILLVVGLASSLYTFRWLMVPMRHNGGNRTETELVGYSSVPKSMLAASLLLAAGVLLSSLAFLYLPGYIAQSTGTATSVPLNAAGIGLDLAVALAGLAAAYLIYWRNRRVYMSSTHRLAHALFYNITFINIAYGAVAGLFQLVAEAVERFDHALDRLTYISSDSFVSLGQVGKAVVNGQVNTYVLAFALGIAILVVAFIV